MDKKWYPILSGLNIFNQLLNAVSYYNYKGIIISGICFN